MKVTRLNAIHERELDELGQLSVRQSSVLGKGPLAKAVVLLAKFTIYNYECERRRKESERRQRELADNYF